MQMSIKSVGQAGSDGTVESRSRWFPAAGFVGRTPSGNLGMVRLFFLAPQKDGCASLTCIGIIMRVDSVARACARGPTPTLVVELRQGRLHSAGMLLNSQIFRVHFFSNMSLARILSSISMKSRSPDLRSTGTGNSLHAFVVAPNDVIHQSFKFPNIFRRHSAPRPRDNHFFKPLWELVSPGPASFATEEHLCDLTG